MAKKKAKVIPISKSQVKRLEAQKVIPIFTPEPRRYYIDSDGDHKYFVEVGMEGEFQAWLDSQFESVGYEGHDYEKNRIDGRFTFTDPMVE